MSRVDKANITHGVTGFIDILGFGEKVRSAETLDDIRAVQVGLQTIRNQFEFRSQDDLTRRVHRLYRKSILVFSDSLIINVPFNSRATRNSGVFDAVMSELTGYAYAQGECVARGLFLRGGLGLGWWYRNRDTLISSALVHAHAREQSAVVPVIALAPELFEFLSSNEDRTTYADCIDPIRTSFRKYVGEAKGKAVEFWYIDYLGICLSDLEAITNEEDRRRYLATPPESDERDRIFQQAYRKKRNGGN